MSVMPKVRVPLVNDSDKPLVLLDVPVHDLHDAFPLVVDAITEHWELDEAYGKDVALCLRRQAE